VTDAGADHVQVHPEAQQVDDWADRWLISASTRNAVQARRTSDAAVPPFVGMPAPVIDELQELSLRALGQLRDLFRPDLYPPHA